MNTTPWIEVTIVGFVYVFAIFIFFLLWSKQNAKEIIACLGPTLPYVSIVIVFVSYAVGESAHIVSQWLYEWYAPIHAYNAGDQIQVFNVLPPDLRTAYASAYSTLVMLRHLFFGTSVLAIVVFFWLRRERKDLRWPVAGIIAISSFMFFTAWRVYSSYYANTRDAIQEMFAR